MKTGFEFYLSDLGILRRINRQTGLVEYFHKEQLIWLMSYYSLKNLTSDVKYVSTQITESEAALLM